MMKKVNYLNKLIKMIKKYKIVQWNNNNNKSNLKLINYHKIDLKTIKNCINTCHFLV